MSLPLYESSCEPDWHLIISAIVWGLLLNVALMSSKVKVSTLDLEGERFQFMYIYTIVHVAENAVLSFFNLCSLFHLPGQAEL